MKKTYECDVTGRCPYNAQGGYDCRNFCGLGVEEDAQSIPDDLLEEVSPEEEERLREMWS